MAENKIYVQGSYIDIHDNENVYLSVDKASVNVNENENTEQARADESLLSVCRAEGVSTEGQNQNENLNENEGRKTNNERRSNDELFHFIHPSVNEDQEMNIHNEVKRLVKRQGVQMICQHLLRMETEGKLLLPPNPSAIYKELVRVGMPQGDGYSEKNFKNNYR